MIEGEAEFKEVAWVDGTGNSQQTIAYTHLDDNAANGISYYQLKQVDIDGQYEWSEVVAVEGAARGQDLRVYPSPCTHELYIGGDITEGSQLFVLDALGRAVLVIEHATGGAVDVSQLPAGPYYLRAAQPSDQGTVPFIKR